MGGSSAPMAYTPANQAGADASYTNTLNTNTANDQAAYNTAQQGYNSAYTNVVNNPYTAQAQQGVNAASATAWNQGGTDLTNASTLNSYAPAIAQAGFDPLSANYNYGFAQAQDAAKVANAQSGVAGSPFGAGAVTDAGASFTRGYNADTQNRQQQAIAALAALFGQSSDLGKTGAAQQTSAAAAPQAFYDQTQNQNIEALNSLVAGLGSASAPLSTDVSNYGKYLGLGQSATQINDQATAQNNAASGAVFSAIGGLAGAALSAEAPGGGSVFSTLLGMGA